MRYKTDQKEKTRQLMLDAAGRGFRKHGYAGIGVDGLAKAAGVTSGAFYSHFGSKDGAFELALTAGLDEVIEALPRFQSEHGKNWVVAFAEYYLGKSHRNSLDCGCAMATLTPEAVRFGAKVHTIFEKKMLIIAGLIAKGLAGNSNEECLTRAWSMLGVLIGGINVARAMKSAKISEEVAEAIKATAIQAAGRARTIDTNKG